MTQFARPPPAIPNNIAILSYPYPNVLHVALNRPKAYNAMNREFNNTLAAVFDWYENEPSLRVAILGSTNPKAWCAGADLKEWVSAAAGASYESDPSECVLTWAPEGYKCGQHAQASGQQGRICGHVHAFYPVSRGWLRCTHPTCLC